MFEDENITVDDIRKSCKSFSVTNEQLAIIHAMATEQVVEFSTQPNILNAKLTATKGQYLFLNYVALPGHYAIVNGKEKAVEADTLGFMLVELEEGENVVQIIYKSPYKSLIGIGAVAALMICLLYLVVKRRFSGLFKALEAPLYWAAIALAVLLVLFFFVMPTAVCLVKNIKVVGIKAVELCKSLFA